MKIFELPHIIHTAFNGVRGVEIKFEGDAKVVIAFNQKIILKECNPLAEDPDPFINLVKALGARQKFDKKVNVDYIMDYKNLEADNSKTEILRLNHCKEVSVNSSSDINN